MSEIRALLDKYSVVVNPLPHQDGGGYKAHFQELGSGNKGYGESPTAAVLDLFEVILDVFSDEDLADFPNPRGDSQTVREVSGRVTLRVPKTLHAQLDRLAEEQGVSLNHLLSSILQSGATALSSGREFGALENHQPHKKMSAVAESKPKPYDTNH